MEKRNAWARNIRTGHPAGGATVRVKISGTNTDAVLYSDDGVTPKANPFTADAITGIFGYYAADGVYAETVTPLSGGGDPYTTDGITLGGEGLQWLNFVNDFGGVGDGATNNATQFAAANAALLALGGGVLYFPPGDYWTDAPSTIGGHKIRYLGAGRELSTITGNNTAAALIISGNFAVLQDLGVYMRGVGCTGVKITNGSLNGSTGVFAPKLQNVKIKGAALSGDGLLMKNAQRGWFEGLLMPGGGGRAIVHEAAAFHTYVSPHITVNDQDSGGVSWAHGIVLRKLVDALVLQSDDSKFYNPVVEGVLGYGMHLLSLLPAGQAPARNGVHGGTFEGNGAGNVVVENGQNNEWDGVHCESSPALRDFWIVGNVGNHANHLAKCQGLVQIDDPGIGQGIESTTIDAHIGDVTVATNVFGTVIDVMTGVLTDAGICTEAKVRTLATAPNAVAYNYYAGKYEYFPTLSLEAPQNSGGVMAKLVAIPRGYQGRVIVNSKQNGTLNMATYDVVWSNTSAGTTSHTATLRNAVGGAPATLTFTTALVAGVEYLMVRGGDAVTAPGEVTQTTTQWLM